MNKLDRHFCRHAKDGGCHSALRTALLTTVSALTLAVSGPFAHAASLTATVSGGSTSATTIATDAATRAAQQATQAAQQAKDSLSRAVQAMQSVQAAARAAAQARGTSLTSPVAIPNGLAPGGLVPNVPAGWSGANQPTQSVDSSGRTSVVVEQTAPQAILNWTTFNVGANTILTFNQQGNATWTALNQIAASGVPTQILGQIKADGQVYLINPNGIIFGGASQLNVGTLIASSAAISTAQFLNNGIYSTQTGSTYNPSFTNAGGAITVEPGALITTAAPSSVTSGGGYVLLMGTQVQNAGTIVTPVGQTELAAGDNFVLRPGYSTTGNTWSTTRGTEIAPQLNASGSSLSGGSGLVGNSGYIEADTGDITLAGETVVQGGVLISTTSVNTRGTIHLLSSASDAHSSVTLTETSLTAILPDTSGAMALDSQRAALIADSATQDTLRARDATIQSGHQFDDLSLLNDLEDESRIEIVTGGTVNFQNGSLTLANGGQVAVSAAQRVQADTGAVIDVSGLLNVALPMSANIIAVDIEGNELRDSPPSRDAGTLLNDTVYVDARDLVLVPAGTGGDPSARYYTPGGLLEVSGWLNTTFHTVGEWMAIGGQITLATGVNGAVVAQPGSTFNISGGSIQYQSGYVPQTWLVGSDGRIYTANNASADLTYSLHTGFTVDHAHWGVTDVYADPLLPQQVFQQGYTVGRDGGSLVLQTSSATFEGQILSQVVEGARQDQAHPAGVSDPYLLTQFTVPLAGQLVLEGALSTGTVQPSNADVTFGSGAAPTLASTLIWFDADQLSRSEVGGVTVLTSGSVTVNAPLMLAAGGALSLTGANITDNANIAVPSGSITLNGSTAIAPSVALAAGIMLDSEGLWTNALLSGAQRIADVAYVNGGNITVESTGAVTVPAGTTINASSGAAILADGTSQGGNGGDISLLAGQPVASGAATTNPTSLNLAGRLVSYGVNKGGALTLQSGGIIVVSDQTYNLGSTLTAGTPAPFNITLTAPLIVPAGTPIPLPYGVPATSVQTGTTLSSFAVLNTTVLQGNFIVPAGVLLAFSTPGSTTRFEAVPGERMLAGWTLLAGDTLPEGTFLDPAAFGSLPLALLQPTTILQPVGSVLNVTATYAGGTLITAGTVLPANVSFRTIPTLTVSPNLFQSGFSSYTINGEAGLAVDPGVQINAQEPVYRFTAASFSASTGSNPASALSTWTPPLYLIDPVAATLTQRAGASVTLNGGSISLGPGSSVNVDPGESVAIASGGQITVDGTITALSGTIDIVNDRALANADPAGLSVWVGPGAVLDANAAVFTAFDTAERPFGTVGSGGTITLGSNGGAVNTTSGTTPSADAFVIIRATALIEASGANAVINPGAGPGHNPPLGGTAANGPVAVASSGGAITLRSYDGIYADGTLLATSGGAGAAGGTLSVILDSPIYNGPIPEDLEFGRVLTITAAQASGLPANLQAGLPSASLVVGTGTISAQQIAQGGFDNVNLWGRGGIVFAGNVNLRAGESISLEQGALYDSVKGAGATISAPYVLLEGQTSLVPSSSSQIVPTLAATYPLGGVLTIDADTIDVQSTVASNFATTALTSRGDIRFLASNNTSKETESGGNVATYLVAASNLELTAQQVYPASGAMVEILAGFGPFATSGGGLPPTNYTPAPGSTISVASVDRSDPAVPYSVFGEINFIADEIDQGGVVRAPLGAIRLGSANTTSVTLLPGSLTSASAAGLTIPYGGTVDGVTYEVNGSNTSVVTPNLFSEALTQNGLPEGVQLNATYVRSEPGSKIDISGGGTLTGAAFVEGEGGSVDTLLYPLHPGGQVFAVLPGVATTPVAGNYYAAWTGAVPVIGQEITIPAGVPGLPAGTYTLLPANYALLPGAYRVELDGAAVRPIGGVFAELDGSYLLNGYQGIANTGFSNSLATSVLITPGATVRTYSQYNEESYDQLELANAAAFDSVRPLLERDGKTLGIQLNPVAAATTSPVLTFEGSADFGAAAGGYDGSLVLLGSSAIGNPNLAITGPGSLTETTPTNTAISAATIDAIGAPRIVIGPNLNISSTSPDIISLATGSGGWGRIVFESGASLKAGELLIGNSVITLQPGVLISTLGETDSAPDFSLGYIFQTTLIVGNGEYALDPATTIGSIEVGAGASIYSKGTIAFGGDVVFNGTPEIGAPTIELTANSINIGDTAALSAAAAHGILPSGVNISQAMFSELLSGNAAAGVPAVQNLILAAGNSVNFFGSVDLSTFDPVTGKSLLQQFVLYSPAIYGYGTPSDTVNLSTATLVWSGVGVDFGQGSVSAVPGPAISSSRSVIGAFNVNASQIVFGYPQQSQPGSAVVDRLMLGFSTVNLNASQSISANGQGTLSAYQSGPDPSGGYDAATYAGIGGTLNLTTPLLTGAAGSTLSYRVGGALTLAPPAGVAPAMQTPAALGAEIDLSAASVTVSSAVVLPSGKFTINALGDITLSTGARIDVSGQAVPMFDLTEYSWGGDVDLTTTHGNVVLQPGATIDVSAINNSAGTLDITATDVDANDAIIVAGKGVVRLSGTLLGTGDTADGYKGGAISIQAQQIGADPSNLTSDFAALNASLDSAGFFGSRSFDLKQGNLIINAGQTVKAQTVSISIDNGGLDVFGTIDASGPTPGTIELAANGNLTVEPGSLLDAHGSLLQVDSYGQPIDAENRATVTLTTANGVLALNSGSTINVSVTSPQGVLLAAQGEVNLNAPRSGTSTGNSATVTVSNGVVSGGVTVTDPADGNLTTGTNAPANALDNGIAIEAKGGVAIRGAASVALNGFAIYANAPKDPNDGNDQVIDQAYVGLIDRDSQGFIAAAGANPALQASLPGLSGYQGTTVGIAYGFTRTSAGLHFNTQGNLAFTPGQAVTITNTGNAGDTMNGTVVSYDATTGTLVVSVTATSGTGSAGAWSIAAAGAAAFHLRPGVEIDSATPGGNLTVTTDIDLSGYRYGPNANRDTSSPGYGAGEPMDLVIRAGGNLTINGSISDGFKPSNEVVIPGTQGGFTGVVQNIDTSSLFTLQTTGDPFLFGAVGTAYTSSVNLFLTTNWTIPNDTFYQEFGGALSVQNVFYPPGSTVPAGTELTVNFGIAFELGTTWPGVATGFNQPVPSSQSGALPAVMPMLAANTQSTSIRLVSGADLSAANTNALLSQDVLGASGNMVLSGPQVNADTGLPASSVIRTGTGGLDLLAGNDLSEQSLYGIYTAGTQAGSVVNSGGQTTYFPDHGGNLTVVAQGNLTGYVASSISGSFPDSDNVGGWLWTNTVNGLAEWSINFGSTLTAAKEFYGFSGFGTLGGGNVSILVGGSAGNLMSSSSSVTSSALVVAVGATGQVTSAHTITETGGGNITVKIGGALNPGGSNSGTDDNLSGVFTDLRGNIMIGAGAVGSAIEPIYGVREANDPRGVDPYEAVGFVTPSGGPVLVPGDGNATLQARGNLTLSGVGNAGFITQISGNSPAYFNLWQPTTTVKLISAGGYLAPNAGRSADGFGDNDPAPSGVTVPEFDAIAESGSLILSENQIELAPSPQGTLNFLAEHSIYGGGASLNGLFGYTSLFSISGAPDDDGSIYNPFMPGTGIIPTFFVGSDTPVGALHAGDNDPVHIYAVTGDIIDFSLGSIKSGSNNATVYAAAKAADIEAGRDIVNFGSAMSQRGVLSPAVIMNSNPNDVSVISAGRDIIDAVVDIAGPGNLIVSAGRNLYQGTTGNILSIGPLFDVTVQTSNDGAGITLLAGVGAAGPDYGGFTNLYVNPASTLALEGAGTILAGVNQQLFTWLQQHYGYAGSASSAYAFFKTLPALQQDVFVLQVYFSELNASGLEYNDPTSVRYHSYLRGKDAIAALFPSTNYQGDITMGLGVAGQPLTGGVETEFGGSVQVLVPGGQIVVGSATLPSLGLVTQGLSNAALGLLDDIDVYAQGSILLGQARIMTTGGGNILGWSAEGNIDAGRGSKTGIVYTPPRIVYNDYGTIALAPAVPSTGAGIATLNPIPQVPPGNVDLVAPTGFIDAGEAGIRVSGNVNLAALQVLNAANIQVQGTAVGLPTVAAPPTLALVSASNTSAATQQVAGPAPASNGGQASVVIVEVVGYGGGAAGDGNVPPDQQDPGERRSQLPDGAGAHYDHASTVQFLGLGALSDEEKSMLTAAEQNNLKGQAR